MSTGSSLRRWFELLTIRGIPRKRLALNERKAMGGKESSNSYKALSFLIDNLHIQIIDQKPLLNKELQELAKYMAKQTLSTQISCLQCMLPIQLKPKSQKTVGIKYEKVISFIKEIPLKTPKQQEALNYIKPPDILQIVNNGNVVNRVYNFPRN